MTKQQDKEMEFQRKNIEKMVTSCYKRSSWQVFKDFVGVTFLASFVLIIILFITFLFITLIENPVSLGIICLTILLVWMEARR